MNPFEGVDEHRIEIEPNHDLILPKSGSGKSIYWEMKKQEVLAKNPNSVIIDYDENPELKGLKPEHYYLATLIFKRKGSFTSPRGMMRKVTQTEILMSTAVHTD